MKLDILAALLLLALSASAFAGGAELPCGGALNSPISYEDLLASGVRPGGFIHKGEADTSLLDLSEIQKEALASLGEWSRERGHLLRLADPKRSFAERAFARAWLDSIRESGSPVKALAFAAARVIRGESDDTTLWWTFSPYLYQALMSRGANPPEALGKLILWAAQGDANASEATLPGLAWLNRYRPNTYILGRDPEDLTHRFTAQEAHRLIATLPLFASP